MSSSYIRYNVQMQTWVPYQETEEIPYQLQPIMLVSLDQLKLVRIIPQQGTFVVLNQTPMHASLNGTVIEASLQVTPAYLVHPLSLINQDQDVQQATLPGCYIYSPADSIPNHSTTTNFQEPMQCHQNNFMTEETIGGPSRQPKQKKHIRRYGASLDMLTSGHGFPSFYCRRKERMKSSSGIDK